MPQITPIQDSFSAGEISPRCYRRSDEEYWQRATQRLENFFASPRGPAKSRFGFRFLLNEGEAQPPFVCAQPEPILDTWGDTQFSAAQMYESSLGYIVYTMDLTGTNENRTIAVLDVTDDSIEGYGIGADVRDAIIIDVSGVPHLCTGAEVNNDFFMFKYEFGVGSGNRIIEPASGNFFWGSLSACFPLGERANDVLGISTDRVVRVIDKTAWTAQLVTVPSGFQSVPTAKAATVSGDSILMLLQQTSDDSYWFVVFSGSDGLAIPVPTIPLRSDALPINVQPIVIGDFVYWAMNVSGNAPGRILKTTKDGTEASWIDCTFGGTNNWAVQTGTTRLFYSPSNNSVYFHNLENFIYKMDVATEQIERCDLNPMIDPDTGNPYPQQAYSAWVLTPDGQYGYVHTADIGIGTQQVFGKVRLFG